MVSRGEPSPHYSRTYRYSRIIERCHNYNIIKNLKNLSSQGFLMNFQFKIIKLKMGRNGAIVWYEFKMVCIAVKKNAL